MHFNQIQGLLGPEDACTRGEQAGDGATRGDDGRSADVIVGRITRARINDVSVAASVKLKVPLIVAGTGHRLVGYRYASPTFAGLCCIFQSDEPVWLVRCMATPAHILDRKSVV